MIFYSSSGTFAHIKELFKNKNSCPSVEKGNLKQYSLSMQTAIFDLYIPVFFNKMQFKSRIFRAAPHPAAAALQNCDVCLRTRRPTELQWLGSFCLQKISAWRQKLQDAANDSAPVRLLRVSTRFRFAANTHTFAVTADAHLVGAKSLTYECTQVTSVHIDFLWNLYFLSLNEIEHRCAAVFFFSSFKHDWVVMEKQLNVTTF